ncbi:PREDICTED: uncharacterized protein LOC109163259 isoform X3 [Ipomoea nil]|uniref:uncharacterized protein LOC109163259 isoform X3 n=1 Tax=Ipomoea nil TaxID=35883 RepID=UPI000900D313|nr:PREDICTED: uncharacterized protein LOC109163259 isoform X3 [Ipomoea nil]
MISDKIYPELKTTGSLSSKHDNYYLIWKSKILFVLADYGLDDVLTTPVDSTDPQWLNRDKWARYFHILPSLDEDLRATYSYLPTVKAIMDALESHFNFVTVSRKMNLFRCYRNHKMEPHMPINKHIFRMRAMAKVLECAGISVPDEMQAVLLLNSVPEDWCEDVERVQLGPHGCLEEELSLHNATLRLRIASDARKLKNYVNNKGGFKLVCNFCGNKGHRKRDCPEALRLEESFPSQYLDSPPNVIGIVYPQLKTRERLNSSGSDFYSWEIMLSDLFRFSEVSYVLEDPKPPEEDVDRCKKWLADDLLCRHLILGAVDDDLFLSFHGYPSAKSMMDDIKAFFSFTSNAQRKLLLKKYMDHQMSEGTTILNHNSKMQRLALKLKSVGVTIPDELQAFTLMDSMPASWFDSLIALRRDMNLKEKEMDLKAVRARLWEVGRARDLMAVQDEIEMSSKKSRKVFEGKCYSCRRQGHYASECPNKGKKTEAHHLKCQAEFRVYWFFLYFSFELRGGKNTNGWKE